MVRRSIRRVVQMAALVAVVASLSMLLAPPTPTDTPYLSALSNLAMSSAYAANGCPDKACNQGINCVSAVGFKCIHFNGKGCTATACK